MERFLFLKDNAVYENISEETIEVKTVEEAVVWGKDHEVVVQYPVRFSAVSLAQVREEVLGQVGVVVRDLVEEWDLAGG